MKKNIYISVESRLGASVEDIFNELIKLADKLDCACSTEISTIKIIVSPGDNVKGLVELYRNELEYKKINGLARKIEKNT